MLWPNSRWSKLSLQLNIHYHTWKIFVLGIYWLPLALNLIFSYIQSPRKISAATAFPILMRENMIQWICIASCAYTLYISVYVYLWVYESILKTYTFLISHTTVHQSLTAISTSTKGGVGQWDRKREHALVFYSGTTLYIHLFRSIYKFSLLKCNVYFFTSNIF